MNLILCTSSGTDAANWTHLKLWSHMVGLSQAQNVELVKVLWILTAVSPHAASPEGTAARMRLHYERGSGPQLKDATESQRRLFLGVFVIGPCPTPELSQRSAEPNRVVCSSTACVRQQGFVCSEKRVVWFKACCPQKSHCDIKAVFQISTHHIIKL